MLYFKAPEMDLCNERTYETMPGSKLGTTYFQVVIFPSS